MARKREVLLPTTLPSKTSTTGNVGVTAKEVKNCEELLQMMFTKVDNKD